ncbi:hypothetical protein [Dyella sp. 2RAB6]|uniref:hypothetical protein n=1 Tax=Dyella sp. 2RAB6 TaxID=3232992 RepID=UPI003F934EC8
MSDFLDRVATRALGSASMLSPRLPSLFEPAGRGEAAVAEEPLQIQAAAPGERAHEQVFSNVRQAEGRVASTDAPVAAFAPRRAPEDATPAATHERMTVTDEMRLLAPSQPSSREPVADPTTSLKPSRREATEVGELQPLRETHFVHERIVGEPAQEERLGTLLPPSQPVFATRHEPDARPTRASSPTSAKALAGTPPSSSEPVVHVSIGRIEVRAAPTSASAPRRQDPQRSSALDDYLRQRGGTTP